LRASNRNAVYLCQQAAEKIAKAVLESEGVFHGREHRNDVLAGMVPPENPFQPTLNGLADLSPFATA
jgi:HEPN domain-containing protein